jgi:hypothetical protein
MRAFAVCPLCSSAVRRHEIRFGLSFPCSHCGNYLYVSQLYTSVHALVSLALGVFFLVGIGLGGWQLLFGSFLIWLPMAIVEMVLLMPAFPPTLRLHQLRDSPLTLNRDLSTRRFADRPAEPQ